MTDQIPPDPYLENAQDSIFEDPPEPSESQPTKRKHIGGKSGTSISPPVPWPTTTGLHGPSVPPARDEFWAELVELIQQHCKGSVAREPDLELPSEAVLFAFGSGSGPALVASQLATMQSVTEQPAAIWLRSSKGGWASRRLIEPTELTLRSHYRPTTWAWAADKLGRLFFLEEQTEGGEG